MNRQLLFLATAGFLLLAPIAQYQIYGVEETSSTVVQKKIHSDEDINQAIKTAILADKELSKFVNSINITVDKGVVTLNGVVNSSKAKSSIESKAKAVMGVHKVINNLEVKSE